MSRSRGGESSGRKVNLSICAQIPSCRPHPSFIVRGHFASFDVTGTATELTCSTTCLLRYLVAYQAREPNDRHVWGQGWLRGSLFLPRCFLLGHVEKSLTSTVVKAQAQESHMLGVESQLRQLIPVWPTESCLTFPCLKFTDNNHT